MSFDPTARDNIHGNRVNDYIPGYIEQRLVLDVNDIDMNFNLHPVSKDILVKSNEVAIKQSIVNLVMMNYFEKPFRPEVGGDVYRMLFENFDEPGTDIVISDHIHQLLVVNEPRVRFIKCAYEIGRDENMLDLHIYYKIVATRNEDSVSVALDIAR